MKTDKLQQHARDIFFAGLQAVDPIQAIKNFVTRIDQTLYVEDSRYDLKAYQQIYLVGAGKAGASMAQAMEEILGDHLSQGIVNVKYGHTAPTQKVVIHEAGHPLPDEAGMIGTQRIIRLLETTTEHDLVLCLISGGGSALLVAPADGITLQEKQAVTQILLRCGATINEINTLRKHISRIKGGQLARIAYPATVITFILSDVIGDPLDIIASGPTVPDSQTFQDCVTILEKYEIMKELPTSVLSRIQQGANGEIPDTPKKGAPIFEKTHNLVIASNNLAASAAAQKARELGYHTMILSSFIQGEAREVAKAYAAILKEILHFGNPLPAPACLIAGGETTVTVQGHGLGGRNQEFALAAACEIDGLEHVVVLSAGTDGTDGPTDAAGAIIDGKTMRRARAQGLNPLVSLKNNDAYHFFDALGDLLKTGPTKTNVMDLYLGLVGQV
jgi:glycerate 2-kinase